MKRIQVSHDPDPSRFGAVQPRAPRYRGMITQSHYIPLRDGVRLAAQVWLPKDLPAGQRIPALVQQTRYWRDMELRAPFGWFLTADDLVRELKPHKPFYTGRGYALVHVDKRGTGASFGSWPYPWSEASIWDGQEIVDWVVAQPWCNGQVGAFGGSYTGTTAELLAVVNHPAVRAILPMFNHPDPFVDIAFPGGILNRRFIEMWGRLDLTLDRNRLPAEFGRVAGLLVKGVRPVELPDGSGQALLQEAIRAHAANGDVFQIAQWLVFRDQTDETTGISIDDLAVHRYRAEVERSGVPIFGWASWMDAGTADAAIRRFCTYRNAGRAVIGAWDHGGLSHASPYLKPGTPVEPPLPAQWAEALRFFDAYLQDEDQEVRSEKVLMYYTLGEERWHRTDTWPPAGTEMQRWYLAEGQKLSRIAPIGRDESSADVYTVDWQATTGTQNRWWELGTLLRQTVTYPHRAEAGRRLLAYFSPPLEEDTEITGHAVVTLYVTSSEPDCAFYVYLEDVDEQGRVTYLTEGQLRSIHRRVAQDMPYHVFGPAHSFKEADALPLVPGEVAEITFALLPTSALIRRGHRLRLGIAGDDHDTFVRIPPVRTPVWKVERNGVYASYVDVPVRVRR